MKSTRISAKTVEALTCPDDKDRVFLWDDALSGFGVAAHASGKKTYVVQYRQAGRSRRLSLGDHGRITPAEARSEAKKALGAVESGHDPIEKKREERGGRSFGELADEYMRTHVKTKRKARTHEEYQRLLKLHLLPKLGSRPAKGIRQTDIAKIHQAMSDKPGAANRALSLFSSIWNWAVGRKLLPDVRSPARGIDFYPEQGGERYLTTEEIGRLGATLRLAETTGLPWAEKRSKSKHRPKMQEPIILDQYAVAAIRLLLLTGARLREILHAKWSFLDVERGILFLPDSKTGRKPIYLSSAALALLKKLPKDGKDPYIVAGGKEHRNAKNERVYKPRADLKRPWAAIRRVAQLDDVRLHDLRHSFASTGAGASLGLPVIGKLLGHARPETTARYAHLDADPMRRAVEQISSKIAAALKS